MSVTALALLRTRRFWPLCATQACGAFNDNLVKNALVVIALFRAGQGGPVLVALAGGLFILPYMLFSATAGELADRHDKAWLIRVMKRAELALMLVAALGFLTESLPVLLAVLVGLGVQATFFGPLKYGILPDHLRADELVAGNGVIEATTFLAILLGTIAGGVLVGLPGGTAWVSGLGLAVSLAGIATAGPIPPAPARIAGRTSWRLVRTTIHVLGAMRRETAIWRAVLGIGWFWTVGATLVAEFPVVAKTVIGGANGVVTLFLTMFSLGIGLGSVLCARLLRGQVSVRLVPWAAFGISLFTADFALACRGAAGLGSVSALLGTLAGWRLLLDLLLLAACGGLYSVPLYALVQHRAPPEARARMIAGNNVMNAAFMVAGAAAAAGLAAWGVAATDILLLVAAVNLPAAFLSFRLRQSPETVPQTMESPARPG